MTFTYNFHHPFFFPSYSIITLDYLSQFVQVLGCAWLKTLVSISKPQITSTLIYNNFFCSLHSLINFSRSRWNNFSIKPFYNTIHHEAVIFKPDEDKLQAI